LVLSLSIEKFRNNRIFIFTKLSSSFSSKSGNILLKTKGKKYIIGPAVHKTRTKKKCSCHKPKEPSLTRLH